MVRLRRLPQIRRSRATRRRIRRLVIDLDSGRGTLEEALRRALDDDALQVVFWIAQRNGWAAASGEPVELAAPAAGRAVTRIGADDGVLAALVHGEQLRHDPRLLEAVVAAARLAIENERLEAELRARIADVRVSRQRLVQRGDAERRRIERDLHDGAQQRLVSLTLALQMLGLRLGTEPDPDAAELIRRALAVAEAAIAELRAIAQGIFPVVLADEGLAAALEELAASSRVPVRIEQTPDQRLPDSVAAAAYFAAVEAVSAAARAGGRSEVRLTAQVAGERLVMTVDGTGMEPHALASLELEDRVEALGGTVAASSGRLTVDVPVAGWSP